MLGHPAIAFIALGSVVLCVTGAEALYADMGHFGKRPIRARLVRPGDAGAGAQLLRPGRDAAGRPGEGRQSVLRDGADLGALSADRPGDLRHRDRLAGADHRAPSRSPSRRSSSATCRACASLHTSVHETGQIYLPFVNWSLFAGIVIAVVLLRLEQQAGRGLRHHGDDRHADHDDDDLLRRSATAGSTRGRCASLATGFFFIVDFAFFAANIVKVFDGGWFPLADRRR